MQKSQLLNISKKKYLAKMVEANVVVTITGISGFLGSAVAAAVLREHPDWEVRGTVRSVRN